MNGQCYCGHDRQHHANGRCRGDGPYQPALYGTGGDTCRCTRFDIWPEEVGA